jgi:hypothetical protein
MTPALTDDPPRSPAPRVLDRPHLSAFGRALVLVLPAWIAARLVVVGALILAHATVGSLRPHNPGAVDRVHQGLLGWDGGWYVAIAKHGYAASGLQSLRFYPAFPMAGRVLGRFTGIGAGPALVVVANLSSLAAMAGLAILVERDLGDHQLARRSAWLLGLAPAAYILVWGYADGPLLLCAVVAVMGARTGRWWWAAAAGLVAGLDRPLGVLLLVPVLIEVVLDRRRRTRLGGRSPWVAWIAAVVAPVCGTALFLAWVRHQFGDAWLPFRVQQQLGHRGGLTLPVDSIARDFQAALHGHHIGSALHIPWVVVSAALMVVALRRLPLSYGMFAAAVLVVSLTSSNLDSFERYALGAFPLVVAASTFTSRRGVELAVLVVAAGGLASYAFLAFIGILVP